MAQKRTTARWQLEQKSPLERRESEFLCRHLYEYDRVDHDKRAMTFLMNGRVGTGSAACEVYWEIVSEGERVFLNISSVEELICTLEKVSEREWEGAWINYERMRTVLRVIGVAETLPAPSWNGNSFRDRKGSGSLPVKINCHLILNGLSRQFASLMNKVSSSARFYSAFDYDGPYDLSLCAQPRFHVGAPSNHHLANRVLIMEEPLAIHPEQWLNIEGMSAGYVKFINWNKRVRTKNSIYHPFLWFYYLYSVLFDENVEFIQRNESRIFFLSLINDNADRQSLVKIRPKSDGRVRDLYIERRRVVDFMAQRFTPKEFPLFGTGWDYLSPSRSFGPLQIKDEILAKSKFYICFENSTPFTVWDGSPREMGSGDFTQKVVLSEAFCDGYASEKIYHCLLNGAIPIYWGCPNIEDFVPKSCFIDYRDFGCEPQRLYEYLIAMPDDEYFSYRESIRQYLRSELFYLVGHPRAFYETLAKELVV